MCPSERGPPAVTGLFASKATKRSAAQNCSFVPGNKIVEDARRYGAKVLESPRMAFKESLRGLGRKRHDKAIIRVRHIHREKVRLLLHSGDDHKSLAEVGLCFTSRMHQRHEHLATAQLFSAHIVLDDGVAAGEPICSPFSRSKMRLAV